MIKGKENNEKYAKSLISLISLSHVKKKKKKKRREKDGEQKRSRDLMLGSNVLSLGTD
jgi:hypothetical protein